MSWQSQLSKSSRIFWWVIFRKIHQFLLLTNLYNHYSEPSQTSKIVHFTKNIFYKKSILHIWEVIYKPLKYFGEKNVERLFFLQKGFRKITLKKAYRIATTCNLKCDGLRDLVHFYNLKNVKNTDRGVSF